MTRRWIIMGLLILVTGVVHAENQVLFNFESTSQFTGWSYPWRPAGTSSGQSVANPPNGNALQVSWTVLQNEQDWLIVQWIFSTPVDLAGYRYLSMDVKPGTGNVFTNLKLVSLASTFEDVLTNISPNVVPGQWTHLTLDLADAGISGQLSRLGFFIGTHWPGVQVGQTYTLTVDNLVLEEGIDPVYAPPAVEVRPWKNVFFSGERGLFKVFDRRTPPSALTFTLLKNGTTFYQQQVTANSAGTLVDAGVLSTGSYEARAGGLDNKTFSCVAAATNYCRYDWNATLERNGAKIFPMGLFFLEENATDAELAACAQAGFNVVLRPFDDVSNGLQILNRVGNVTNHQMFVLGGPYNNNGQKTDLQYWQDIVSSVSIWQHSSVLGWYIKDEPTLAMATELSQITTWVKQTDPYHPTFPVLNSPLIFEAYASMFDMLGGDNYPYPNPPISVIGTFLDRLNQSCNYQKPTVAILQAFRDVGIPVPPPSVVRAMTYLAIAHHVKGIIYFAFQYSGTQPPEDIWRIPQSDPALWNELSKLAGEVKSLNNPLLIGTDPGLTLSTLPAQVHYRFIDDAGNRYLLLVNPDDNSTNVSVSLPDCHAGAMVTSVFDNTTFAGPTWSGTMGAYAVKLYRWPLQSIQNKIVLAEHNGPILNAGFVNDDRMSLHHDLGSAYSDLAMVGGLADGSLQVSAVAVGDVNNDGRNEVVVAYRNEWTNSGAWIKVYDYTNRVWTLLWSSGDLSGGGGWGITGAGIGNADNSPDGSNELVLGWHYGSRKSQENDMVILYRFTGSSLPELYRGPENWSGGWNITGLGVGNVTGDSKNEVVVSWTYHETSGTHTGDTLQFLDFTGGVCTTIKWDERFPFDGSWVTSGLDVGDADNDGTNEIAVTWHQYEPVDQGIKLALYTYPNSVLTKKATLRTDNTTQWGIYGVGIGNADNGRVDVAAVLAALDSQSNDGNWNPAADLDNDGEITSTDLSIALTNIGF